jgi:signal transduction histidine kinase
VGPAPRPRQSRLSTNEQVRRETELAQLRVLVALALFVQGLLVPLVTAPRAFQVFVLGLYAGCGVGVLAALHFDKRSLRLAGIAGQTADVVIGAGLLHFGTGPSSLLVLVLALLGAAHRGGLRATVIATAVATVLTAAAPFIFSLVSVTTAAFSGANVGTAVAQCGFVLLAGAAIGYVTESSDRVRSETEMLAAAIDHADVRLGLKHTMAVVFDTIVRRFSAVRAVLIVREISTDRVFMWQGATLSSTSAEALRVDRLEPRTFDKYVVVPDADAWSASPRGGAGDNVDLIALDRAGDRLPQAQTSFPETFLASIGPFAHLMGFVIERPGEWTARLFLIDPRIGRRERLGAVELGQRIVRRICPVVDNVSLLHRLRSRSASGERTRIARELHDGIVQSVMGIEIQLRMLAGKSSGPTHALGDELNRLADLLGGEALALRDMLQRMQPLNLAPERLIDTLEGIVQRFQYETGINARFIFQYDDLPLSPHACREITQVVQEALVNVRKHSGAASVLVRFTCADGVCRISIDDDGRGFPSAGQSSAAGDWAGQGPRVIKERVRLLGGDVTVESAPNQGARVAISIPLTGSYVTSG